MAKVNADIQRTGAKINLLKHNGRVVPLVTDHAIVRYLERVEGLDIEDVRRKILGHSKRVQNGDVIVTVNPIEEKGGKDENSN